MRDCGSRDSPGGRRAPLVPKTSTASSSAGTADECSVVAFDHRHARSHHLASSNTVTPAASAFEGAVQRSSSNAPAFGCPTLDRRPPSAATEVVEVEAAALGAEEKERRVRPCREPVKRGKRPPGERHLSS